MYEYMVKADGLGWQHWREQIPPWIYPKQQENPDYSQLIIPTLDSVRYKQLFSLLHTVNKVRPRLDIGQQTYGSFLSFSKLASLSLKVLEFLKYARLEAFASHLTEDLPTS